MRRRSLLLTASARTFAQRPRPTAATPTGSCAMLLQLLERFFDIFRGGVGDAFQKFFGSLRRGFSGLSVPPGRRNFSDVAQERIGSPPAPQVVYLFRAFRRR